MFSNLYGFFMSIREEYMSEGHLHYRWKIEPGSKILYVVAQFAQKRLSGFYLQVILLNYQRGFDRFQKRKAA